MSNFLPHVHAEIRRALHTRRGSVHGQKEYPEGTHKAYPRMEQIALPAPAPTGLTLDDVLRTRGSRRTSIPGEMLTLAELGTLLGHALGKREGKSRNYPSGGRLYPIETYLLSTGIEDNDAGVFHYNPSLHTLERLWSLPRDLDFKTLIPKPVGMHFSAVVVFTAVWKRSSAKYGDLTYSHGLLEAGHMSENVLLVAESLTLNACPMAGFNDALIQTLLDIDPESEQPVHTIALSKTEPRGSFDPNDVR